MIKFLKNNLFTPSFISGSAIIGSGLFTIENSSKSFLKFSYMDSSGELFFNENYQKSHFYKEACLASKGFYRQKPENLRLSPDDINFLYEEIIINNHSSIDEMDKFIEIISS